MVVGAKLRILRGFFALYGLLFLYGAEMYLVSPVLPLVKNELHIPFSQSVLIITVYVIAQAILSPLQGWLYPLIGGKKLIILGAFIFTVSNLAILLIHNFPTLLIDRSFAGIGVALSGPAMWTWIVNNTDTALRGSAIGYGLSSFALGQICGVPLGAFIATLAGWRSSFLLLGLLALISIFIILITLHRTPQNTTSPLSQKENTTESARLKNILQPLHDKFLTIIFFITLLFHTINLGVYAILPTYLQQKFHLATTDLGYIGLLSGIGIFLGSFLGGQLIDHTPHPHIIRNVILPLLFIIIALNITITVWNSHLSLTLINLTIWFTMAGIFDVSQQTLITHASNPAGALGWNLSFLYLGTGIGSWIFGLTETTPGYIIITQLSITILALLILYTTKNRFLIQTPMHDAETVT